VVERLGNDAIDVALTAKRLDWRREGDELVKVVRKGNFAGALAYVNAVGALAEAADHHPTSTSLGHRDPQAVDPLGRWPHAKGPRPGRGHRLVA